jgi:hypothetical protein
MRLFNVISLLIFTFWASNNLLAQKVYDIESVNTIELIFEDPNWQKSLERLKMQGKNRLKADLILNGKTYKDVGVRYKGNSSFFNPRSKAIEKLPFNIKSDYKIKDQKFEGKYDRIKLSNVFADPSFIREVLAYHIAGEYSFAPKANFVKLVINGEAFGVYTNTQSIDSVFLEEHFGESDGVFLKCDKADKKTTIPSNCGKANYSSLKYLGEDSTCYFNYYELKSDTGWNSFIELCKVLNTKPKEIESVLDVDKTLWMHAFNTVLVNLDSYTGRLCHNYYMYRGKNGQFVPLIWDLNLAFGVFKFDGTGPKLSNEEATELSIFTHYKDQNKDFPLITNLLANPLYRNIYIDHIRTILEEYFVSGLYYEYASKLHTTIKEYVEADSMKLYSNEQFVQNLDSTVVIADFGEVIGIKELMENRTSYLMSKPYMKQAKPDALGEKITKVESGYEFSFQAKNAKEVFLVYRKGPENAFVRVAMEAKTTEEYIYTLDCNAGTEYYFIASNGKAVTHFPLKASYEFLTVE